jgi:predicted nucleic acid-binding protein
MIAFDASTLILLAKINILELFISNFPGAVLIPEKVKEEACSERTEETPLLLELIQDKKIEIVRVKKSNFIKKLMDDFNIHDGEAEAIVLALRKKVSIIGTDDRNAIRACRILKIDFTTTVAILIRAFEKKLIDKDEALIKLQKLDSIARYSRAIVEDAQKQISGGDRRVNKNTEHSHR